MPKKKTAKKKDAFGYSEMVWAETLDPEYARVREELRRVAVSEGALSVKVKEMIVIGILAKVAKTEAVDFRVKRNRGDYFSFVVSGCVRRSPVGKNRFGTRCGNDNQQ